MNIKIYQVRYTEGDYSGDGNRNYCQKTFLSKTEAEAFCKKAGGYIEEKNLFDALDELYEMNKK